MRSIFVVAGLAATAAAECTREGLLAAASSYVAAQTSGKSDGLTVSSTSFAYHENNKASDLKRGIISQPLKVDLTRSTADTTACASYTLIISASGPKPYILATQIRHDGNDTSKIALIDTIAATTGSLFFNATKTLGYIKAESWTELAPADRPSRDTLKKFGDGYLDMWTDKTAADSLSWGTDCERVEGSQLTRPCGASLPRGGSSKKNGNRRYVIDEVLGSVDVLCSFDSLGPWPDSHEIRVENGKVKYVHTVTLLG